MHKRFICLLSFLLLMGGFWPCNAAPATMPSLTAAVGEKVPSEDPVLKDFHSMGLINGRTNIFRCACPVRDLSKEMTTAQPDSAELSEAVSRMRRMYDLGIRTVISLQNPDSKEENKKEIERAVALEKAAAAQAGLSYVACPMSNSGPDSLQTMSDAAVLRQLQGVADEIFKDAANGGVAFHCTAGHDRAGIVAAYLRIKYQHWPVEQAIAEMRRYGHNWLKFSRDDGVSSWHEDHLRAIAKMLN